MAHIFQINTSGGGVPKQARRTATVGTLGILDDVQRNTKVHGGPDRALCLYSLERIEALQQEGHPIYPGTVGENITISGLDWDAVVPGARIQLGAVLTEVTGFASPCNNIRHSFANENFKRISEKHHPGWARAYVRVLLPGEISVCDPVSFDTG